MPYVTNSQPGRSARRSSVFSVCLLLLFAVCIPIASRAADVPKAFQDKYREIYAGLDPASLQRTIQQLSQFPSRVAGYPGADKSADYVERQFRTILGPNGNVMVDHFKVTVPFDPSVEDRTGGAFAQLVSGDSTAAPSAMYPLWPNLVRTPTLPANGLTGPLIYVEDGKLHNFNGKDVDGAVVLVDFNCAAEWMNAPRLGARAVIFVAPADSMRGEAEAKFISIPIAIPRFYMSKEAAAPLLAACASGRPPQVKLTCKMPWETRDSRNITGVIPGTDPEQSKQLIVVQSYYDSTSVVPALAPGADTACGMAAMLEMMRYFAQPAHAPKRTMMFVATSAHFQALQGIREYVEKHLDEWTDPSMAESALSREHSSATALWLGVLLGLMLVWLIVRIMPRPGATRSAIGTGAVAIIVILLVALNAGFYLSARGSPLRKPKTIYLWVGLDLTSQTRSVGIFYKGWFYDFREDIQGKFSDIARVCRENAEKVGTTIGFDSKRYFNDGVNPVDGKNWRNFIPGKPAFDSEVVTMAGGNGVTFASTDDSRARVDTPFDTVDHVNIANLAQQVRLLDCLMWHIVTDTNAPGDVNAQRMPITDASKWSRMALQGGFATLQGRAEIFNPKKSFVASPDPKLADTLVVVRNRNKSYMGVRGNMVQQTSWTTPDRMDSLQRDASGALILNAAGDAHDASGAAVPASNFFAFHGIAPLTAYGNNRATTLAAYHLDYSDTRPDPTDPTHRKTIPNDLRGEIDYAPDLGASGAKVIPLDVMVTTAVRETPITMFRCVPTAIYDLVDQQSLRALTGISVYDGESNGEPTMYGFAIDPQDPSLVGSYVEDVAVLFSQPGSRLKIAMTSGPGAIRLLLINSQYDPTDPFNVAGRSTQPEGKGYLVAGDPNEAQNADLVGMVAESHYDPKEEIARSGAIYDTALHVAEDMWKLDDFRMNRLARYRILDMHSDEGIPGLHKLAAQSIARAKADILVKNWERFDSDSRDGWGFESRAYPDVQQTAVDVVQGVLFYLALLMPFAYFGERLFFGFFDLKRQLMAAAGIFLAIFMCFRYIHPAFDITMNPVIVLLAFVMLALSTLVMGLIAGKFEQQLKAMNQSIGGVHKADIGRVSIAVAAFNLGISNMRRRKIRTFLTCTTLVLLTFTVLSFTSVVQTIRFNEVPAPSDHGPRYNGIMIRTAMWDPLQEPAYRLLSDEYGRKYAVAPRAWFYGTQMGEQSFLTLRRADKFYEAKAMVGLSPAESRIGRLQDALLPGGRWFAPGDVYVVILPDSIANALRVDESDVGKAKISYSGVDYTVIGILDSQKLKDITDLDNEPLTPVDFIAMNKLSRSGSGGGSDEGFKEYTHLEPDSVFFMPYQTATNMGAELRSIGIDFNNKKEVLERLSPLMHRLGLNLYAGEVTHPEIDGPGRGVIMRYSSIASTSSRGLELVFFPIVIASLIVLNTMLGSVMERVKEIHMFSSIGLAPSHIGMLFMAEALVYAIIGSVAGYLLGQLTSKLLVVTHWLPDLYLNFSSVSAVMTTLVVVSVVLLSTIYPARKASEVATPAIDRTWKAPEPDGDHWVIPLPFAVTGAQASGLNSFLGEWFQAYEEYSIGDFVTQNVVAEEFDTENGLAYRIKCMTWLAPFDLGVSQRVAIETRPTTTADVFEILLHMDRESGDISNWKRVNRRFLNTLRKQFLIWRTLKQADRERYLLEPGADAPAVAESGGPTAAPTSAV